MQKFKDGEIQILIATTVIEVGVNVPNASIMVVENAERFGLAQLHQLRGRVGRGEYQSYCILKYEGNGETVRQRMKVMCDTNDGFIISEKDLELRGSGDFFGTEQHGLPEFKIANLFEDIGTLKKVQGIALKIMEDDPLLEKDKNEKLKELVKENFDVRVLVRRVDESIKDLPVDYRIGDVFEERFLFFVGFFYFFKLFFALFDDENDCNNGDNKEDACCYGN